MIKLTLRIFLPCLFIVLLVSGLTGCRKSGRCEGPVCQNGGYCSGDTCACKPGYFGDLCENFSACDTINCMNGGTCANGACQCANGYYGLRCDSLIRDLYLGTYTGTLTLSTSTTGVAATATVTAGSLYNQVTITVEQLFAMNATLTTGGNFTIPSQTQTFTTVSGSGSFSGNTLNLMFAENVQITTINGSFVGTN